MTTAPANKVPASLRAFLDVADLPSALYGRGQAKITRRLVHLILAKHANPDGTAIYPSKQTLGEECAGLTEHTLGQAIGWLEGEKLVRRLPDLHPRLGTIQYELMWPEAHLLAAGKKQAEDRDAAKREATRRRTEKWRSVKKRGERVTKTVSVTSGGRDANLSRSVTLDGDAVTLGRDAVTLDGDACDAENPAFSPSTVLLDRPIRPSPIPSTPPSANSDGGLGGVFIHNSKSTSRTSEEFEQWTSWMSDLVYEKTGARHSLTATETKHLKAIFSEAQLVILVIAFYNFCNRPKGLGGLSNVFGMFCHEWPSHLRDAERFVNDIGQWYDDVYDLLGDLHGQLFNYEDLAHRHGTTMPSMALLPRATGLLALDKSHNDTSIQENSEPVCTETV
jgi:hypothetical protein